MTSVSDRGGYPPVCFILTVIIYICNKKIQGKSVGWTYPEFYGGVEQSKMNL